ncbi:MAG: DUF63 family protein, partial [Halobacteria archaeon]|nr:DUF63 family protein [Halobacteria archaeon]
LLDRFDVGNSPSFFYGLVPFAFVGGALRVVEDTGSVDWPLNFFIISPVIYFTMFFVTAVLFVASIWLENEGYVDSYAKPLAGAGTVWLVGILTFLAYFGATQTSITLWIPFASLGMATLVWAVVWFPASRFVPEITEATGWMGAVILWGHMVDAAATTIGIEYLGYGEKHPVVQAIIDISGTTYTFIPVKAGVVLLILYAFDEQFFEDFDRLPYLLLVAVLAIGLGPGTRNFLRATLGI